eukprot:gnl/MRDRNA2_/MRDRNA2_72552_c0_seq1.p1 gnl/MRDRNA2_/MRDRNA2_72552_c0~~gnl/MRDRNA2_/MRDRNA2_72552_c0_seq1.p1  ORF type:complete len:176 (-),score=8.35 gnl/MRDRNA2_/MRDRNA2_72552_c0_seq1:8-535(-)
MCQSKCWNGHRLRKRLTFIQNPQRSMCCLAGTPMFVGTPKSPCCVSDVGNTLFSNKESPPPGQHVANPSQSGSKPGQPCSAIQKDLGISLKIRIQSLLHRHSGYQMHYPTFLKLQPSVHHCCNPLLTPDTSSLDFGDHGIANCSALGIMVRQLQAAARCFSEPQQPMLNSVTAPL